MKPIKNEKSKVKKVSRVILAISILAISAISIFAQISPSKIVVKTKKITGAELKSLAAPNENKQPVLLNFWATWCGPCRVEFPELVKIDNDYRRKGLNFALVSVDDAAIIDTRVPEFLEEYVAEMPSYLLDLPNRTQIAGAVRRIAPGFIDRYPLTLLFDVKGKLVYQKFGVIDAKILRREIDKAMTKTVGF